MATWPQTTDEWAAAIEQGMGLSSEQAQQAYKAGQFAYGKLEEWIRSAFSEGFSPEFVPALLRNKYGLVDWVYGAGSEPYWPGSDITN